LPIKNNIFEFCFKIYKLDNKYFDNLKRQILLLFLIFTCNISFAQNAYVDSLKNWIKQHPKEDSLAIVNYYQLSYRLAEVDPIEAWKYAYEVDKLAIKAKIKTGHAMSKINFGLLERLDGNYVRSLEYYLSAMQIAEKVDWTAGIAICLNNIGEGYKDLHQYEKCIEYAKKAININQLLNQKRNIANNYEVIGDAYYLSGKQGLALDYFKNGFELAKNSDDSYQIKGKLLTDIGKVYSALKSYPLASKYFESAAKLNIANKEKLQLIDTYTEQGKSNRSQGELEKAIVFFKKGLSLAEELNYINSKSDLYREMSVTNHMLGNMELALDNFQTHKALDDQIAKRKTANRNEQMKLKLESFYKEQENVKLKQIKELQASEIKSKAGWIGLLATTLFLSILGASYWFYKNRIQNLKKVQDAQAETIKQMQVSEQIRKQIARDLHDDMGSTLSSISILSQVAVKEANTNETQTKELLSKINRNSQRMLDTMNDIVWTTQPVNDTFESISIKIREYAAEMFDAKDVKYNINIADDLLEHKLPPNQVYNFYLIIKESINNITKYAHAQNVTVNISKTFDNIKLLIEDDGNGFDVTTLKSNGNGLKNIDKRSADLNGNLSIESSVGFGTKIKLEFPLV
jgi:signal transduction histidine kinase